MLLYYGDLKWRHISSFSTEMLERIKLFKMELTEDIELHEMFKRLLIYVRGLKFEETPDYNYLKEICLEYKNK